MAAMRPQGIVFAERPLTRIQPGARPMSRRQPFLTLLVALFLAAPALADMHPLTKEPANIKELKELQTRVQDIYKKVTPAVVGIQIGGASGSGVIVTEDGYVLTAGHVSGKPDQDCTVIFPDGKKLKAKSLGQNRGIDSGMIQITETGQYPHVEMGDSKSLQKGQWVVSLGHPGGFVPGRSPVLRLGRVINSTDSLIQTDCTLVGGDSGGPLFDLDGKVIGIHSRIGPAIASNIHVPVDTYTTNWDDLVAGKEWGNMFGFGPAKPTSPPSLGLSFEKSGDLMKITGVDKDSAAEKVGFKVRDLIEKLDGKTVSSYDDIVDVLKKKKEGEEVTVDFLRAGSPMTLKLKLGKSKS